MEHTVPEKFRLTDGRAIALAAFGAPDGLPTAYCHGFPGSRLEAGLLDAAARAAGLRVIALDRPGLGGSDFQAGRTLAQWPADVAAVMDALGIERFRVLGLSGGGPYATACAAVLGRRVERLSLVCPLGPLADPHSTDRMGLLAGWLIDLARAFPAFATASYSRIVGPLLGMFPTLALSMVTGIAPPADREVLAREDVRSIVLDSMRAAFAQGGAGAAHELQVYTHDWGVDLGAMTVPVDLWHGEADRTVPIEMAHWYAQALPGCAAHLLPDEGHFSLPVRHAPAILKALARPV
ncbi:MAG: alpha/beta hydrolase [Chromatiales bacterium]|nr:alpha/beta hydrolase [Chromatiales bacterium]